MHEGYGLTLKGCSLLIEVDCWCSSDFHWADENQAIFICFCATGFKRLVSLRHDMFNPVLPFFQSVMTDTTVLSPVIILKHMAAIFTSTL